MDEQPGQAKGEISLSRDANLISKVISQELTIRALQFIAQKLNDTERKEVVAWAEVQAEAISVTAPEYLRGDKYLRVEPPCSDAPSVLDFVSSDEAREAE
ncbi:MAG TPA: hypothetical protein DCE56_44625 [Cyanobacteria bacterium UBA8553]|nr:hypothetical protein [Cyanobacteria bacterium UBA8553]